MASGPIDVLLRVVDILEELEIPYVLGGSLASSLAGEPRATADVDLAIRIGSEQLDPLVRALEPDFYVSEEAAAAALRDHASFNVVHLEIPAWLWPQATLFSSMPRFSARFSAGVSQPSAS